MRRRFLLLPIAWLFFGAVEVFALDTILGGIVGVTPTIPNDKPIGGSILPVLFFNLVGIIGIVALTLYTLGVWNASLSTRKAKTDLIALAALVVGGFMLWYSPLALFPTVASLVYFLAVNLD